MRNARVIGCHLGGPHQLQAFIIQGRASWQSNIRLPQCQKKHADQIMQLLFVFWFLPPPLPAAEGSATPKVRSKLSRLLAASVRSNQDVA